MRNRLIYYSTNRKSSLLIYRYPVAMLHLTTETMKLRLMLSWILLSNALLYANCFTDDNSENPPSAIAQPIDTSWVTLQVSPNVVCYKPFENVLIKVYEDAKNAKNSNDESKKRYFFAPVGFLDHNSSVSTFNTVTQKAELRFRVFMWNDSVRRGIVEYCFNNSSVRLEQVQVLPFEQVHLFSTTASASYSLPANWLPYQQHRFFRFAIQCTKQKDCDILAENMKRNPQHFDHFKLQFSMSSQSSRSKETLIRTDVAVSGRMASSLLQRFKNQEEVLLTADDTKKLLKEMTTNVMVQSFDDSEVVSPSSESKVYEILESMFQSTVENTKDMNDRMWESVFWDNDNYRPDKVANTLNDNYKKSDKETQKKIGNAAKTSTEAALNVGGWAFSGGGSVGESSESATSREDVDRLMHEARDNVVWNGEKFVPKPMSLRRLNIAQLRDNKSFQDQKVRIRYTVAILMTPLNILKTEDKFNNEVAELRFEMKELQSKLQGKFDNEVQGLRHEIKELKGKLQALEEVRKTSVEKNGKIPTSCSDLKQQGHTASGIHFVLGAGKLNAIHCDFNKQSDKDYQVWIGFVEAKSKLAYFSAKRFESFSTAQVPIPFPSVKVNAGGAFNSKLGIFTVPTDGIYFFIFNGVALEGHLVASICVKRNYGLANVICFASGLTSKAIYQQISIHATETLKRGDQVFVKLENSTGTERNELGLSIYSGWLLHEEI